MQVAGLGDSMSMMIPRGEAFVLRASAKDGMVVPDNVSLKWRQSGSSSSTALLLTKFGPNDFRYDFPAIQSEAVVELSWRRRMSNRPVYKSSPVAGIGIADCLISPPTHQPASHRDKSRRRIPFSGDDDAWRSFVLPSDWPRSNAFTAEHAHRAEARHLTSEARRSPLPPPTSCEK